MTDPYIAITIIWAFLFVYAIAGSIDFGAGFWAMYYTRKENTEASVIANRYLSPSWEVTNVFLVLLVVALVGFFPGAASYLGTLMILPFSFVLILLTIRGTFMVYAYSSKKYSRMLTIISGTTGLFIPALLVATLPIAIGGFVSIGEGRDYLLFNEIFASPTLYTHIGFGLSTELFLASLLLSDYSREAQNEKTYLVYRKNALWLGPVTLLFAVAATFTLLPEAGWMVENMMNVWYLFAFSLLAFIIGYAALFIPSGKENPGRPRLSVIFIVIQFGLASLGYGFSHMPYILYPDLTIQDAFTDPTMFRWLLVGYGVGLAILVPAFVVFWRLFMKDKRYLQAEK
ncbi:cytochrome d ubiquinol oxidase subunit II [Alteribacter keqinensis]|uniref:Cytochrome d ubiquinol oxidase subunit II n=1 Tax=Alteribacter keqinensis TaxID=2483800 RepID=A0A3M7TPW7_9BACI|nr:cytochrome d ubiquinol oxidase subunit II [Alteribacter keqinensis]RNA66336.1 hypothetical protein EBO34_19675 [Alteribacter keqinensis]